MASAAIARLALGVVFLYHGLVPKLLFLSPDEVRMIEAHDWPLSTLRVAQAAGAAEITHVDQSESALAFAAAHHVTDPAKHRFITADVFHWLPSAEGSHDLVIVDPQAARAHDLIGRLPGGVARAAEADIATEIARADGLINATPIGMDGHPGTPIDVGLLRRGLWVADVVYFPLETELLRAAQAIGCRTAHGGDMAVFQAARAFDLFTGHHADSARMAANF